MSTWRNQTHEMLSFIIRKVENALVPPPVDHKVKDKSSLSIATTPTTTTGSVNGTSPTALQTPACHTKSFLQECTDNYEADGDEDEDFLSVDDYMSHRKRKMLFSDKDSLMVGRAMSEYCDNHTTTNGMISSKKMCLI